MAVGVREVLASVRCLLAGGGAFILGNSLLGIALPLRMEAAGYPVGLIGAVMTAYYAGQALGGIYGKRVILRVGHISAPSPCSRRWRPPWRSPTRSPSRHPSG